MELRILGAALALACMTSPVAAGAKVQSGRDCHLPGTEEVLRCHLVPVPLNPLLPGTAQLQLHVTVAPAFRKLADGDPLFVLAGGPGQSGSDVVAELDARFQRVRATRDIVFIDQRGTGLSGKLSCASTDLDERAALPQVKAALAECLKSFKHPLSHYTTANAAHDIERVRLALGYGKVNVFGGSYGTRLGQHYARSYPASVRALIFDGVAAPDQIIPAGGRDAQAALDGVFQRCAQDNSCARAFPDLRAEFDGTLARVHSGAVKLDFSHPRTMLPTRLPLSAGLFVSTIHSSLYSPSESQRLPYLIHSAYRGNWGPFVARAYAGTDLAPEGPIAMPLFLAVVCAEDMPRLTPAMRHADERASFMRGHTQLIAALCPLLGVPSVTLPATTPIVAPALLLSGALDPVTPPHRAKSAAHAMSKAQHFVVQHASHGVARLGCAPRLLREFLDQPAKPLDGRCLNDIAATPFQLGHAGIHP